MLPYQDLEVVEREARSLLQVRHQAPRGRNRQVHTALLPGQLLLLLLLLLLLKQQLPRRRDEHRRLDFLDIPTSHQTAREPHSLAQGSDDLEDLRGEVPGGHDYKAPEPPRATAEQWHETTRKRARQLEERVS